MSLSHVGLVILGIGLLWFASGLIITGVEHFAKKIRTSTFSLSFVLLGLITSITEISVGINAVAKKTPEIFVGNLIGGSFVVLMFIIPLLAIFNHGVSLRRHLRPRRLFFFLVLIAAPLVIITNGSVTLVEAGVLILLYILFMYSVEEEENTKKLPAASKRAKKYSMLGSLGLILGGVVLVFGASYILINEIVFTAAWLGVPPFLISIIVLSVGTNLPELFVVVRAIKEKKIDIAIGDFMGSAAANTLLFGVFTLVHGSFTLTVTHIVITFFIMMGGYLLFFLLSHSQHNLTAEEGAVLITIFICFIAFQVFEVIDISLGSTLLP